MTKILSIVLPDGVTTAPATDFGGVPPGSTAASRNLLLKNTGTDPIPSIRGLIEQASTADGAYVVSIAGIALTGTAQELLSAPLAAGGTLSISESWTTPAGVAGAVDTGTLVINYDQ